MRVEARLGTLCLVLALGCSKETAEGDVGSATAEPMSPTMSDTATDSPSDAPSPDTSLPSPSGSPDPNPSDVQSPAPSDGTTPGPTALPSDEQGNSGSGPQPSTGQGGSETGGASGIGGHVMGGNAGSSTGGTSTQGGTTATAGSGGTPASGEPALHFVGRFEMVGDAARFAWSGSGVTADFEGDSVTLSLEDGGSNQFTVVIDGEVGPVLLAQAGTQSYPLASGLGPGPHRVEVYRRTEASFGASAFHGFDFGPDGTLLAPRLPSRTIEVIGDSITCGYGNEGATATCGFSADTENHYLSYGAIAARALDAEVVTIAWSGKGVVNNYDTDTNDPMPALYDRIVPTESGSVWDFALQPDAVVINLGTNDFSTDGDPTHELFAGRYLELLEHLRAVYPDASILCTVGPMLGGADLDAARAGIADAVTTRNAAGDDNVEHWEMNIPNDSPGCDYHPSLATHQAMADALVAELTSRFGF